MDTRLRRACLAILATAIVACGSAGAGSPGPAGGDNYLTANESYGVGIRPTADANGAAGGLSDPMGGATLLP